MKNFQEADMHGIQNGFNDNRYLCSHLIKYVHNTIRKKDMDR